MTAAHKNTALNGILVLIISIIAIIISNSAVLRRIT